MPRLGFSEPAGTLNGELRQRYAPALHEMGSDSLVAIYEIRGSDEVALIDGD
jgi:hypothetical protein